MSYAEQIMNEIKQDQPEETPAPETPVETPAEDPKPEETPGESTETAPEAPEEERGTDTPPEEETAPEAPETPKEEPKKPDLSTLSKEEKAQHAFKRQLQKQKEKHAEEMQELAKSFEGKLDAFKKELLAKKEPEQPKVREDFDSDDDYINYLLDNKLEAKEAAKAEVTRKEQEEKAAKEKEEAEARKVQEQAAETFNANCAAAFGEELPKFQATLQKAVNNGLAELLDSAPAVRDYIFEQPDGPVVLNEILNSKEAFIRIMTKAANPMTATIEMHDLAKEVKARAKEAPAPKPTMPPIGKPGAKQAGHSGTMWDSDQALIDFVRSHR